jgi:cardiolipin synthase
MGHTMSIPNIISVMRVLLVPLTAWLMLTESYLAAFFALVAAGISDGIDGYLARRFNWQTELGAYLDALADKALLVTIYAVLGWLHIIPLWLVILVVTRDILIISAVILSRIVNLPMTIRPLWISKVNTVVQIVFAGLLLLMLGTGVATAAFELPGSVAVAALTLASGALYVRDWLRQTGASGARH